MVKIHICKTRDFSSYGARNDWGACDGILRIQHAGNISQYPFLKTPTSHQFSSVAQSCSTLCNPMNCSTPGLPVHHQLLEFLKLMSIESVMPSNHLILCHPLLRLPSIFPSIRVFSNESALPIRWPKYWRVSFSISNILVEAEY